MGRGQYDRAAAQAKREQGGEPLAGALHTDKVLDAPQFVRPGYPYLNAPETIVNAAGQTVTQADYDKLVRLCQTHGLMIDG